MLVAGICPSQDSGKTRAREQARWPPHRELVCPFLTWEGFISSSCSCKSLLVTASRQHVLYKRAQGRAQRPERQNTTATGRRLFEVLFSGLLISEERGEQPLPHGQDCLMAARREPDRFGVLF